MRIAIYSRKSVETDTGESIKNQITFCKQYFERQSSDCKFEIFEDEGFSGGNINRPSFQRMMDLVKIKQFDVVAVYKIDRIARNIVDFVNVYDELERVGVKLVSITEGFDPSTPVGKMMMLLLASFAEMERMNIAQRVKDNMKELAKMGRWSGGTAPTGYASKKIIKEGKKITYLELVQEEGTLIKEIFEKYASGYSLYEVSKYFKNKGLNYPAKTIQNILTNPTYLISSKESIKYLESQGYSVYGEANGYGFLPYNRRPKKNGKKLSNDVNKFVGISNHDAIIDLDLWIKVQERLNKNKIDPHPRESEFTFLTGGILKCKCGSNMFVSQGRKRNDGTKTYYFRCSAKKYGSGCDSKFLKVDVAEQRINDFLRELTDKEKLKKYINKDKTNSDVEKEIKSINKKININNKSIENLVDKLMMLTNNASTPVTKKIEELTEINNSLKEDLLKLEREKLFDKREKDNIETLHGQISNFVEFQNSIEDRRRFIKNIIKEIIWDSEMNKFKIELFK